MTEKPTSTTGIKQVGNRETKALFSERKMIRKISQ